MSAIGADQEDGGSSPPRKRLNRPPKPSGLKIKFKISGQGNTKVNMGKKIEAKGSTRGRAAASSSSPPIDDSKAKVVQGLALTRRKRTRADDTTSSLSDKKSAIDQGKKTLPDELDNTKQMKLLTTNNKTELKPFDFTQPLRHIFCCDHIAAEDPNAIPSEQDNAKLLRLHWLKGFVRSVTADESDLPVSDNLEGADRLVQVLEYKAVNEATVAGSRVKVSKEKEWMAHRAAGFFRLIPEDPKYVFAQVMVDEGTLDFEWEQADAEGMNFVCKFHSHTFKYKLFYWKTKDIGS